MVAVGVRSILGWVVKTVWVDFDVDVGGPSVRALLDNLYLLVELVWGTERDHESHERRM